MHILEKVPRPARAAETIAAATEQLEKLIPADGRKTVKIVTAVRIGKAYEQIIQFAQESQIDLAIMGVRGRGGVDLAIFGSTTYRVMQLGPARSSLATFRHLSGYTTHVSFGQKSRSSGPLACNPWYRSSEWTVLRSVQCAPTAIQGSYGGQGSDMTI